MLLKKLPQRITVPNTSDLPLMHEVLGIISKYGYGMIYFGKSGASFYKKTDVKDGYIPIDKYFFFSRKETMMLIDVLKKLDEANKKVNNYILQLSRL